jgi:hypothetical protein
MYLWVPVTKTNITLVLTVFILVCILGMTAASYPQHCLGLLNKKREKSESTGHHPDCGEFESHTFTLKGRRYCAGCSGLFLGGVGAILCCLFYYIYGFSSPILFWVGVLAVFLAFMQLNYLKIDRAPVKFFSNLVLVIGSAIILVGILEFKPNLSPYFLVLIGLWIYTRTTISATDHDRICSQCPDAACPYH